MLKQSYLKLKNKITFLTFKKTQQEISEYEDENIFGNEDIVCFTDAHNNIVIGDSNLWLKTLIKQVIWDMLDDLLIPENQIDNLLLTIEAKELKIFINNIFREIYQNIDKQTFEIPISPIYLVYQLFSKIFHEKQEFLNCRANSIYLMKTYILQNVIEILNNFKTQQKQLHSCYQEIKQNQALMNCDELTLTNTIYICQRMFQYELKFPCKIADKTPLFIMKLFLLQEKNYSNLKFNIEKLEEFNQEVDSVISQYQQNENTNINQNQLEKNEN